MDVALKPYKKDFPYSYTMGVFPTIELLQARPDAVLKVLLNQSGATNKGVAKIEQLCEQHNIRVEINDRAIERLAAKENVYAIGVFHKYSQTLSATANHLVLVNPGDMGNLGTILRTALGFGIDNLALIQPAVDIFDPKAVRASMGALFKTAFHYFDTFAQYRESTTHNFYPFMTDGDTTLQTARFAPPYSLIFGNESAGLDSAFRATGTSVTIPHSHNIDSLNLTIAVGIALYAATREQFT